MNYDFLDGPDEEGETFLPFQRPRAYGCYNCRAQILFGNVLYMSAIEDGRSFTMAYVCESCTDGKTLLDTRFQVDRQAMRRLFGTMRPHLPYRAAPGPYASLSEELEHKLQVFAFDLDGIESLHDLLLYVDGPGSMRVSTPTPPDETPHTDTAASEG